MKKTLSLLTALAFILSLASGCSLASKTQAATQAEPETLPDGYTQVYGKIKSANGNEILLVMGTLGGGSGQGPGSPSTGENTTSPAEEPSSDGVGAKSSGVQAATEGSSAAEGDMPSSNRQRPSRDGEDSPDTALPGGFTEGTGPGASQPGGDESAVDSIPGGTGAAGVGSGGGKRQSGPGGARSESTTLTYTGEERLFLIPVTAAITSGQGESARTVRFTQLAVKNVVGLTLDGNGSIVSIQIIG